MEVEGGWSLIFSLANPEGHNDDVNHIARDVLDGIFKCEI